MASSTISARKGNYLESAYVQYSATATDEDILAGDPNQLQQENLLRLAKRRRMGEVTKAVLAHHPNSGISQPLLSNRLARAITKIAQDSGKARDEVVRDLRAEQKRNGVSLNGKRMLYDPADEEGGDDSGDDFGAADDDAAAEPGLFRPKRNLQEDIAEMRGRAGDPPSLFIRSATERGSAAPSSTKGGTGTFDGKRVHQGGFRPSRTSE